MWLAWLTGVGFTILAVELPWLLQAGLDIVLIALNLPALRRLVLLRGPTAIRWIEWTPDGRLWIGHVPGGPEEATLGSGSFRLGFAFFLLWFSTSAGTRGVLIDGGLQAPAAFRRLSRGLKLLPSRPKV